jgi:hypothetical protein
MNKQIEDFRHKKSFVTETISNALKCYRKNVAKEIFAEIEACFGRSGALPETVGLVDFIKLAELKKKYESEGADDD